MDPNQTNQPPQAPAQPTVTPAQPPVVDPNAPIMPAADPLPAGAPQPAKSGGGKKTIMILIIVFLVAAILIVGGILMYTQVSKNNPDLSAPAQNTSDLEKLQTDAKGLDLGNVEADFKDVDIELKEL